MGEKLLIGAKSLFRLWCWECEDWFLSGSEHGTCECGQLCGEADHIEPYSYVKHNARENFIAACQLCNGFKSDKVFEGFDEIRDYLLRRWAHEIARGKIAELSF